MNASRTALLTLALTGLLDAGESDIDLAALPAGAHAKDAVLISNPAPRSRWSLAGGVLWRKTGGIRFDTGVSPDEIPNLFGVDTFTAPPGIGALNLAEDRTYDDGFVHVGAGTPIAGLTTFWSYGDDAQVRDDNMVYSRAGGERRDVTQRDTAASTGWRDDAEWEAGPFVELTYSRELRPDLGAGFSLNFSSINIGGTQAGQNTLSQFQQLDVYDVTAVDTYALNGVIPPGAPYSGSFSGPGPLLGNFPDDRVFPETLAATDTALFVDSVRDDLDLALRSFGIGGHVHWMPRPQVLLSAQAGVSLNIADWRAQRDEVIMQANNGAAAAVFSRRTVRADDVEFLAGLYLQGNAVWELSEHWAVQGYARYDWNEDLDGTVGDSSFDVDISGWSVGGGVRLAF